MGVDPFLQDTPFTYRVRLLTGFAGRVRTGYYGQGKQIQAGSVSSGNSAGHKYQSHKNTRIRQAPAPSPTDDRWVQKSWSTDHQATPCGGGCPGIPRPTRTVSRGPRARSGNWWPHHDRILLPATHWRVHHQGNSHNSKQTEEFKMGDITFFAKDKKGNLRCLPRDATADLIAAAEGATMKLDNQKNGWKGVCVYQETNGDPLNCPVRALGWRYLHLRMNGVTKKTIISAYFNEGRRYDVTSEHVSSALKMAAGALEYPTIKCIPIERVNTHSLRSGGANALALAGYSDTQVQKMGRWRGATFKEYVRNELTCFSSGMSRDMKQKFGFVNVSGNAFSDITDACVNGDYSAPSPLAVM